ncbi:hypothetical protein ACP70R_002368 [Stipagrostis hirtigluma subsp. patula]
MATATALSLGGGGDGGSLLRRHPCPAAAARCCAFPRSRWRTPRLQASRADDSSPAPFEMTVESALKLLGVSEGASFDEILRAKNAVLASCRDDQDAVAQVEAAYDMLLMQSLSQRRAGKVVDNSIRYADVKPIFKVALITVGGLAAGATVGSAVENFLQVDIVPFLGIHSPAVVVSEFILFSQLLVSLFVR